MDPKCVFGIILLSLLLSCGEVLSQGDARNNFSTQATDPHAKPNARRMGPRQRTILFLIKNNPQGTLYGNPCFKEVSHRFGFEYLLAPVGMAPYRYNFSRSMHNLGVNVLLFFRNGPFWKLRVKKKFHECKYGYGDFVG